MTDEDARYVPIIYVRGYAMTRGEIDQTTADPFCGFNLGSTVQRATADRTQKPKKFVFESPVVRLASEYQYRDVYDDGVDIVDPDWKGTIGRRSVVIFRYYDSASTLLGEGETPSIGEFAKQLAKLIIKVRELVCADQANALSLADFRCYLVAHSMGGLVCRALLQNPSDAESIEARACVARLFTYATPHNGIDTFGVNVPSWLTAFDIDNFNRKRIAEYLNLETLLENRKQGEEKQAKDRGDLMPESAFPSKNVFCMVGTNRGDYDVAAGLSRTFAGHGSDGLVRIANASVWGVDDHGNVTVPSATAYAYRTHSGFYGIVNSEEAYQNLVRFLFGDLRVDMWLEIDAVQVPQELQADDAAGKVDGLYQFEVHASPRGKRWFLTRRVAEEDSVAVRTHAEVRRGQDDKRNVYLSSMFLALKARVDVAPEAGKGNTLAYQFKLGVRCPDWEVDKKFWPNRHYEGQYLFDDSVVVEVEPPAAPQAPWKVWYDWQSENVGQARRTDAKLDLLPDGTARVRIPFTTKDASPPVSPGITGHLCFRVQRWNV